MALAKQDARDVRVDPLLSSISVAFRNQMYLAPLVAPVIPSALDAGKFTIYNQADWFRNEAGKRSAGARAKRGDFGITFGNFLCEEYAFAKEIPDEIRRNAMDPIRPDQDGTEYATDKVLLNKEVRVAAKFDTAANWQTSVTLAGVNQWNDYTGSDPIADVETATGTIQGNTGYIPNVAIIPTAVWRKLRHHPDIVDRIKYSQRGVVTVDMLKEIFDVPTIYIAQAISTTANEGVAAGSETYSYVWGKDVWIGYVAPNPGLQVPTAMYQFSSGQRAVRRWREEDRHQDVVEAYELMDENIVSKLMGYLIKAAVA